MDAQIGTRDATLLSSVVRKVTWRRIPRTASRSLGPGAVMLSNTSMGHPTMGFTALFLVGARSGNLATRFPCVASDKQVLKYHGALAAVLTTVSSRSLPKGQQNIERHLVGPLLLRQWFVSGQPASGTKAPFLAVEVIDGRSASRGRRAQASWLPERRCTTNGSRFADALVALRRISSHLQTRRR